MPATTRPAIFQSDYAQGVTLTDGWAWTTDQFASPEELEDQMWSQDFEEVFNDFRAKNDGAEIDVVIMPEDDITMIVATIGKEAKDFHLPHAVAYEFLFEGEKAGVLFQFAPEGSWFFLHEGAEDSIAELFSEDMGAVVKHIVHAVATRG